MWNFFLKYELQFKILAVTVWTLSAIENIFFDKYSKNRSFDLFVGIIMLVLAIFYLVEVIDLVKKKKHKNQVG